MTKKEELVSETPTGISRRKPWKLCLAIPAVAILGIGLGGCDDYDGYDDEDYDDQDTRRLRRRRREEEHREGERRQGDDESDKDDGYEN